MSKYKGFICTGCQEKFMYEDYDLDKEAMEDAIEHSNFAHDQHYVMAPFMGSVTTQ